jgi:hypothetical protein
MFDFQDDSLDGRPAIIGSTSLKEKKMKNFWGFLALILVIGGFFITGISAQEGMEEAGQPMPEMGPPQQIKDMAFMVGDWTYKGRMRMTPDDEWIEHEAKVTNSYVAGGAALQMEYSGAMMGMEMHGLGLTTYDRETGEWQDMWVDNFGARISLYTGKDEGDKRVSSGKDFMGGQVIYTRVTSYDITPTEFKWQMENSTDGENWYTSMEGVYTKNK